MYELAPSFKKAQPSNKRPHLRLSHPPVNNRTQTIFSLQSIKSLIIGSKNKIIHSLQSEKLGPIYLINTTRSVCQIRISWINDCSHFYTLPQFGSYTNTFSTIIGRQMLHWSSQLSQSALVPRTTVKTAPRVLLSSPLISSFTCPNFHVPLGKFPSFTIATSPPLTVKTCSFVVCCVLVKLSKFCQVLPLPPAWKMFQKQLEVLNSLGDVNTA